jgi:hypothetical protein
MAEAESTRAARAVNPDAFERDILNLTRAGLRVVPRPDIEAVEVRARALGHPPTTIVMAPNQALELAERLVAAVLDVAAEAGVGQ